MARARGARPRAAPTTVALLTRARGRGGAHVAGSAEPAEPGCCRGGTVLLMGRPVLLVLLLSATIVAQQRDEDGDAGVVPPDHPRLFLRGECTSYSLLLPETTVPIRCCQVYLL